MDNPIITRYAPTPSGFLHLGNLYSFVLTYHTAKKEGAKILLRIDDLDKERTKQKFLKDIFETLDFMEIPYDFGPKNVKEFQNSFSQFKRLENYKETLQLLKDKRVLFACDCSRNKILKMDKRGFYSGFCRDRKLGFDAPEKAWRIMTPDQEEVGLNDYTGTRVSGRMPGILKDFIVRKKDGLPSYQLSSLVDDIHFGVNLIVRGKDLYGSSLAQIFLSQYLEENSFSASAFLHHPILKDQKGQKLSKSAGSSSIQHLRKSGKKKSEIYTTLADYLGLKGEFKKLDDFSVLVR